MLMEIPIDDIHDFMKSYDLLSQRVAEAKKLLRDLEQDYLAKTLPVLNVIVAHNPNYLQIVGDTIFSFVQGLAGS